MLGEVNIKPLQFFWGHLGNQTPQRHDLGCLGCLGKKNQGHSKKLPRSELLGQPRLFPVDGPVLLGLEHSVFQSFRLFLVSHGKVPEG